MEALMVHLLGQGMAATCVHFSQCTVVVSSRFWHHARKARKAQADGIEWWVPRNGPQVVWCVVPCPMRSKPYRDAPTYPKRRIHSSISITLLCVLRKEALKGILKTGYTVPTPIQKKAIPLLLQVYCSSIPVVLPWLYPP